MKNVFINTFFFCSLFQHHDYCKPEVDIKKVTIQNAKPIVLVLAAITKLVETGCLKQQKIISLSSGDWKVQDQCASNFSDEGTLHGFYLPTISSHRNDRERERKGGREKEEGIEREKERERQE